MTFTVRGTLRGREAWLMWSDGEITGSAEALTELQLRIQEGASAAPTPTGPVYRARIAPSYVAHATFTTILDDPRSDGDDPGYPPDDIDVDGVS